MFDQLFKNLFRKTPDTNTTPCPGKEPDLREAGVLGLSPSETESESEKPCRQASHDHLI